MFIAKSHKVVASLYAAGQVILPHHLVPCWCPTVLTNTYYKSDPIISRILWNTCLLWCESSSLKQFIHAFPSNVFMRCARCHSFSFSAHLQPHTQTYTHTQHTPTVNWFCFHKVIDNLISITCNKHTHTHTNRAASTFLCNSLLAV